MVKLYDIDETAVFAWSNDSVPLIATGTLSGVMDDTFSSDSSLSIYNPFDSQKDKKLYTASAPGKFSSIDWSKPEDPTYSRGILACGLENSTIQLYDAAKIIDSKPSDLIEARIAEYKKHTTPVLQVCFNPLQSSILASSGSKGEIFIWDIKKGSSFTPGQAISPMSKVSSLAWNNNISHIFGTAGDNGYTSIWDLKAKREVLQLTYENYNLSVLKWHPNQSTKLVTASDSDNEPVILTWDLRNSSAPEKVIKGHKKGILSLDWCLNDPNLLLSSSKDDTCKLWNPVEGYEIATYPSLPNWVHQTKFAPRNPEIFGSATLSKKIAIQSLQDTSEPVSAKVQAKDEDDFWNQISTTETQQAVFKVQQAPQWLKRPASVNFAYGGKLVIVNNKDVKIKNVSVNDDSIDKSAKNMIAAISNNDFQQLCESKLETDPKSDWSLLKKLISKESSVESLLNLTIESQSQQTKSSESTDVEDVDDDDFFAQIGKAKTATAKTEYTPSGSFELFSSNSDEFEKEAVKLILSNKTDELLDLCIEKDHILEALVVSLNGPENLKEKAKNAFFSKYAGTSSFSRLLYSVSSGSIGDIVKNADISSWNEIATSIIKFSKGKSSFNVEMKLLGDRLLASDLENARDSALSCYAAADALGKVAQIWLSELNKYEKHYLSTPNDDGSKNTAFEARFKALGEVIEKVVVFESTASSTLSSNGDLSELGKAFVEYADSLVNFGHYELAYKLLNMISESIPDIKIEKERISKAFIAKTAVANSAARYGSVSKTGNQPRTALSSTFTPAAAPVPPIAPVAAASKYSLPQSAPSPQVNTATAPVASFAPPPVPAASSNAPSSRRGSKYVVPQLASLPPAPAPVPASTAASAAKNPYQPQSTVGSVNAAPTMANSAQLAPGYQSATQLNNPYAVQVNGNSSTNLKRAANPYAPKTALDSLSNPQPTMADTFTAPAPPSLAFNNDATAPLPPAIKKDAGGWNDLPSHLAPVVKPTPAATNGIYNKPAPNRIISQPHTIAPPPAKGQPSPYSSSSSPKPPSRSSSRNPYAPKPEVFQPVTVPTAHSPLVQLQSPIPVKQSATKNPYAPKQPSIQQPQSAHPLFQNVAQAGGNPSFTSNQIPPPPPAVKSVPPPPQRTASIAPPAAAVSPSTNDAELAVSSEIENICNTLTSELERAKPGIPEKFTKHIVDSEKRLAILFNQLRKGEIAHDLVDKLQNLSTALAEGNFEHANSLREDIAANNADQCGNWITGIKRLIGIAQAMSK